MKKIVSCTISPMPKKMFDDMPKVTVTYDDGSTEELFQYFPDEISFTESEFIGLTSEQAHELRHRKDVAYLRS
jgi:hypothetical protein